MRFAIPLTDGVLAQHFGHCERFAFIDVDKGRNEIVQSTEEQAPEHEPGLLPRWLHERGATVVIAGARKPASTTRRRATTSPSSTRSSCRPPTSRR